MSFLTHGRKVRSAGKTDAAAVPSRRTFLASLAAISGAAACSSNNEGSGGEAASAPQTGALPTLAGGRRIDVHHHYGPPGWLKIMAENNAFAAPWKTWSVAKDVEDMDRAGVQTSISSITTPGVYFAEGFGNGNMSGAKLNNDVVALARECNEYGAKMKQDYPGRFGIWASLPLPDVDASLREIEYALDTLKCEGICVLTSIGSRYPGDPLFVPVFEELNRRKTVLYTHPQVAPCCRQLVQIKDSNYLGPTTLEYSQDTARAIASWVDSGNAERFPDIPVIFSHGGGNIWSQRFVSGEVGSKPSEFGKDGKYGPKMTIMRRFYYDIAQISHFLHLQNLKTMVGVSQILLGSDYPYGQPAEYAQDVIDMVEDGLFTAEDEAAIGRGNALRLLPQLNTPTT